MTAARRTAQGRRRSGARVVRAAAAVLLILASPVYGGAMAVLPSAAAAGDDGHVRTRTLVREHQERDGSIVTVDTRTVTVRADRTTNLRGRETVHVSWEGAHPSAARALNPYSIGGLNQEYPVVILQCRGVDDPRVPADRRLTPETCWTTSYTQRWTGMNPSEAVWMHDLREDAAGRADEGARPDWPQHCNPSNPFVAQYLTPFVGADGEVYETCNVDSQAPEMALGGALPANDVAAFTRTDGTGDIDFEVRSNAENASLGCTYQVDCAIVVIPVMGISCLDADPTCRGDGIHEAGSTNFSNLGVDPAVSAKFWWSESNWRNRFTIPIGLAPPPTTCDVLDDRTPVEFYGSELLSEASLQWAPAYCTNRDRFKLRHNRMPEGTAFTTMLNGQAAAAFVTDPGDGTELYPVVYAPVAVTGFAVGFVIDKQDGSEARSLRLTPRLLAKLMTSSYPGARLPMGERTDLAGNPLSINQDPEFKAINPGLPETERLELATLLSLNVPADTMQALTTYIEHDDQARAFLEGEPDEYGMRVNDAYKGIDLPRDDWPLLDSWVRPSGDTCDNAYPAPWFNRVSAPVSSLRVTSEALLDAWPTVLAKHEQDLGVIVDGKPVCKLGRADRQGYGSRFMMAVVALPDALRYGLNVAELRTGGGSKQPTFAAPTDAGLAAAVAHARQDHPGGAFTIPQTAIFADPTAYPGTMIVHTAALMTGLDKETAADVAEFIRVATTEGQQAGIGNGLLPPGYLPIRAAGVTEPLYTSAQDVAEVIELQPSIEDLKKWLEELLRLFAERDTPSPPATPPPPPASPPPATLAPATLAPATPLAGFGSTFPTSSSPLSGRVPAAASISTPSATPDLSGLPGPLGQPQAATPASLGPTAQLAPGDLVGRIVPFGIGLMLAAAFAAPLVRLIGSKRVPA